MEEVEVREIVKIHSEDKLTIGIEKRLGIIEVVTVDHSYISDNIEKREVRSFNSRSWVNIKKEMKYNFYGNSKGDLK